MTLYRRAADSNSFIATKSGPTAYVYELESPGGWGAGVHRYLANAALADSAPYSLHSSFRPHLEKLKPIVAHFTLSW